MVAEFEDGTTEVGDLLIGADGVSSRVRACILPEHAQARNTGMFAIGGFCRAGYAPPPELAPDDELTFLVGPKHQIACGKFGSSTWAWWCHPLAAFARFETLRKRTAEAFVKQAYANDRRSLQEHGPVQLWLRDHLFMPLFAPVMSRMLEKHYAAPVGSASRS